MQKSFDDKNVEMLQEVMSRLPPEASVYLLMITVGLAKKKKKRRLFTCAQEAKYHFRRCVDSGLWVPEPGEDVEPDGEEDF